MSDDDIIRIDGVEYDVVPGTWYRDGGCIEVELRPKRKQTKRIEISVPVGYATIRAIEIEVDG